MKKVKGENKGKHGTSENAKISNISNVFVSQAKSSTIFRLLLFALPTSDRVVTRTPLHPMYDFLYELLSSRLSCFSFRSLLSATRSTQCRTTIVDAVMKLMKEFVTLLRRSTSVFGTSHFCFGTLDPRFQQHEFLRVLLTSSFATPLRLLGSSY